MVSESVGTVMCVKLRWHAGFHSNVFMKVLEWRKWGRVDGKGVRSAVRFSGQAAMH